MKKQIEYEHNVFILDDCETFWNISNNGQYVFIFLIKQQPSCFLSRYAKKDTKLQIATIMFSLGILQKDMFPIKYQPLCFPLKYYK